MNMLFRKKIFMGECSEGTVYYNTKTNEILVADNSRLLNTKKSSNNGKYAAIGTAIVIILTYLFKFKDVSVSSILSTFFDFLWFFEIVFLCWLLEKALYKNVKKTKLATRKQFRQAIYSNTIWKGFADKKVTLGKKICWWFITLIVLLPSLVFLVLLLYFIFIDTTEVIPVQESSFSDNLHMLLLGVVIFLSIYLTFQNNIIRWLNIVGKYQNKTLKIVERKNDFLKEKVMNESILPLGSVVTLKDGDGTELMIITRAILVGDNKEEFFDYGSVLVTEGMESIENIYFFNRENVGEVVFKGYINKKEEEYIRTYDEKIAKLQVKKGTVN